jgi:hypothetical protein
MCIASFNFTYAQEIEEPIIIHPIIGEKLDRAEEEYFKLFQAIEGFQEAKFYLEPDSTLQAHIVYESSGVIKDTILQKHYTVEALRKHIDQILAIEINTTQNIDRGMYLSALSNSNTLTNGELLSIRDSSFLLLDMEEEIYYNNSNSSFDVSHLQLNEISKVTAIDKLNIAKYLYPVVAGLSAILIYNASISETKTASISEGIDNAFTKGLLGGLIGGFAALIGYLIADAMPIWSVSETEYTAPFNEDDIIGLSKLARYKVSEPFYLDKIK